MELIGYFSITYLVNGVAHKKLNKLILLFPNKIYRINSRDFSCKSYLKTFMK